MRSKPANNVDITITPDADVTVNPTSLTFTPDTWNSPQTVTVHAVDDNQDEGAESAIISHSAVSGDAFYNNIGIADVAVSVTDNDAAGIEVSKSELNVTEGGSNDTYTLVLARQPSKDVQITLSADPQVTLSTEQVTFTSDNWATARTISVVATDDDLADGNHDSTISHSVSSLDTDYDGIAVADVVAHGTDNDSPGISVSRSMVNVTEGGAGASYTIELMSQPTANVRITVGTDEQLEPIDSWVFNATNWNQPKTFTVQATDDDLIEGTHTSVITHSVTSGDTDYAGMLVGNVKANITDNNQAGVTLSQTDVAVTEGDTCDTYTLALTSQPAAPVTITLATDTQVQPLAPVVLTASTWNQPQTISVCAVDDAIDEETHYSTITQQTSSQDANYQSVAVPGIAVTLTDNDTAGVSVAPVTLSTTENGKDATYTLVLMSKPTANVTITMGTDAQVQSLNAVSFTPSTWDQPQTVTVRAVDDEVDENGNHASTITHDANGGGYGAITIADVTVSIGDNDSAGVEISQSDVSVTEGGTSDTYTVRLSTMPTDDVTIELTTDGQVSATPAVFTFTPNNWDQPRTVTIAAADDALAEGEHFSTITHAASGGGYDGLVIDTVLATIVDDDAAGVELVPNTLTVTEGGTSASYTIKLTSEPAADVTISMQRDAQQVSVTPAQVTLTPSNWQTGKTVTVGAVDDDLDEGVHASTITHSATSTDNDYQDIGIGNATITLNDNDSAGIEVSKASVSVTEGGADATYTIRLTSEPRADVTLDLSTDDQVSLTEAQHTFTTANWDDPWTITVSAVDDALVEGNHNSTITHHASSSDAAYHNIAIDDLAVQLTDDDDAGVTLSATDLSVSESGNDATYTAQLTSQPTGNVTITLSTDNEQIALSKTVLNFTPTNWETPQSIRVTAHDDYLDESDTHYSTIAHQVSSSDDGYNGLGMPAVTVGIADNDARQVTVMPASLSVSEGASEAVNYTIVLESKPTSNVRITMTTGSQLQPVASLLFTPDTWSDEQEVSIKAVDDEVAEGEHESTITHSISGGGYDTILVSDVKVTIADNENIDVDISRNSITLMEDGAGTTYNVKLKSRPTSDVTIQPTIDESLLQPVEALVFTPQNWNVAQQITVTALMNERENTNQSTSITHAAVSGDASYDGLTIASITVTILDDDAAGIEVAPLSVNVQEGSTTATYTVRLTSEPTADVVIAASTDAQVQDIASLRFTSQNWDTLQYIQVHPVDDALQEGNQVSLISHSVSSTDTDYAGMGTSDVTVNITDNDTAAIQITPTNINALEGGAAATYNVKLTSQPQAEVTIDLAFDAQQLDVTPAQVTFTPGAWATVKTIEVTAIDDDLSEGPHNSTITHSASSTDSSYDGVGIDNVTVEISDDDAPGINISQSSLNVTEGSTNAAYTIVLTSQPRDTVTIDLPTGSQLQVTPPQITFDATDWNQPKTIQVNAVDDDIQEGTHPGVVSHEATSTDADYHNAAMTDVVATITDNDMAGVDLSKTTVSLTEGETVNYTIRLTSKPTATVVIALHTDEQLGASQETVTFTPDKWNTQQTITLEGLDDYYAEGIHYSTVGHTASSSAPAYDAIAIPGVVATITDNERTNVAISADTLSVTEGGTNATYTVKLTSQPTDQVTITIGTDNQLVPIAPLTFTPANWATEQTVTVQATDDPTDEGGQHASTITHSARGGDYDSLPIDSIPVTINDNDSADVDVSKTSMTVTEGESATYTVKLTSKPTSDVSVQFTTDGELQPMDALVFTSDNWNTPQTVTVQSIANDIADGNRSSTIAHNVSSGDPMYDGIGMASVGVSITDDDSANVLVTPNDLTLQEGGTVATYTVRLSSRPTANVTVDIIKDTQVQAGASLLFTTANWNTPQTVSVQATDDDVVENAHASTLTHAATSDDTDYDSIKIASVTANITDNDTAGIEITPTNVNVKEGDTTATYNVKLTSQPQAEVTIDLAFDAQQLDVTPAQVTFTPGAWSKVKTIEVTAIDDDLSEGPQNSTITHSATSDDPHYNEMGIDNVTVAISDDDAPGINISQSSLNVTEGSTNAAYTIVLNSQPRDTVTIDLTTGSQVHVNPTQITFDATNWNTPWTIQVSAEDDDIQEGTHPGVVSHEATSTDADYHNAAMTDVVATITDNDSAGVDISTTTVSLTEGEPGSSYTIRLTSEPTATVVIALHNDQQLQPSQTTLTFKPGNWDQPQTITLDATDDYYAEGIHYSTVGHTASSSDPAYNAIAIPHVAATITDDDSKGVSIEEPDEFHVTEGGKDETYTVKLTSKPTGNVTVTIGTDSQLQPRAPLIFTPDNWATEKTVTVQANDDERDEGGQHASTITHSATGGGYDSLQIGSVSVTITDNDTAGVNLSRTSLSAIENGTDVTYRVNLTSQPNSNVTIQFNTGSDVQSIDALVFTPLNWSTVQTVTVHVLANDIADGNRKSTIVHTASSGDTLYDGMTTIPDVGVSITDDDSANVLLSSTDLALMEGSEVATYTVQLTSRPTAEVTIGINTDTQVQTVESLLFTPTDWNQPQSVVVRPVDDHIAEGDHASTITHQATSTDPVYNAMPVANVTASISDNETAGIELSRTEVNVTEASTSDTYTIRLTSEPTDNVTIVLYPDPQVRLSTNVLTFTAKTWSAEQTVTVFANNDDIAEGNHQGSITHSASGGDYSGMDMSNVKVYITDDDEPGVDLSRTEISITEGGICGSYTIVLTSQPTANVTVDLATDEQEVHPIQPVVFTDANWNKPRTIEVCLVDDEVAEGTHQSTITHTASGGGYNSVDVHDIGVSITDNDLEGIDISRDEVNIAEGDANATYLVKLTSRPTATVVVSFTTDSQLKPIAAVTFTPDDWATEKTITVAAVNDDFAEGLHASTIMHSSSSSDSRYEGLNGSNVTARITDDDVAGVNVSKGTLTVSEDGTNDTYTIRLFSQPTANVTVTVQVEEDKLRLPVGEYVFTPSNWDIPKTVLVEAYNDDIAEIVELSTVTHSTSSMDEDYQGIQVASIATTVQDDDDAGVATSRFTADIAEAGTPVTYTVNLKSQPTAPVTITLDTDDQVEVQPVVLSFTPATWQTPQVVQIAAVDDDMQENNHHSTIVHRVTSKDAAYNQDVQVSNLTVAIADNDTAGVNVSRSQLNVAESGATAVYSISLTSQPRYDVTLRMLVDEQIKTTPATLTFTPSNWDQPRQVRVAAIDDNLDDEQLNTSTVTHDAKSKDPDYHTIGITDVRVDIADDDMAEVIVQPTSIQATESGQDGTYTIMLNSQPLTDVVITMQQPDQVTVMPSSLTFTQHNWNQQQAVTVTAKVDDYVEGTQKVQIGHTASGTQYKDIAIDSVEVEVIDNNTPGIELSTNSVNVAEEGPVTDTYKLELSSRPTETVRVGIFASDEVYVSPTSLTFIPGEWNRPQTVVVYPIEDRIAERNHTTIITHAVISGKSFAVDISDVQANIADNDTAAVVFASPNHGDTAVLEDGSDTDTYELVLTSQPRDEVVVALQPDDDTQFTVNPISMTFTLDTWDTPRAVTLRAIPDSVAEGLDTHKVNHIVTSQADSDYDGIGVQPATVNITDTSVARVHVSKAHVLVTEGVITDTYEVKLTSEPTDEVTVDVAGGGPQITVQPEQLVFTKANWAEGQTIVVEAVEDNIAEGVQQSDITHNVSGGDYSGVTAPNVTAHIQDNNDVGIDLSKITVKVTEGVITGTTTYEVKLTSKPTSTVKVDIDTDDQVDVSETSLTYEPDTWNQTQVITVWAEPDDIAEPKHTTFITHTASGGRYSSTSPRLLAVEVFDLDKAGLDVQGAQKLEVVEGGSADDYTIRLTSEPLQPVTIKLETDGQVAASPQSLTFTASDWDKPKRITVSGNEDDIVEGEHTGTITHTLQTSDPMYSSKVGSSGVTVHITELKKPGVVVNPTSLNVTEGGSQAKYAMLLKSKPTHDVTIRFEPGQQLERVDAEKQKLTFTSLNWSTPQTITLRAKEDAIAEPTTTFTITHDVSSDDTNYRGIEIANVGVTISDNDIADIIITQSDDTTFVTEGSNEKDTYDVRLNSQPTAEVRLEIRPSEEGQVKLSASELTFTPENWDTAQPINVQAEDDGLGEGSHTISVTHKARGGDYTDQVAYVAVNIAEEQPATPDTILPIEFAITSTFRVNESTGVAEILLRRTRTENAHMKVAVCYETIDVTANAYSDYLPDKNIFELEPHEESGILPITLLPDERVEGNEVFLLRLSHVRSDGTCASSGSSVQEVAFAGDQQAGLQQAMFWTTSPLPESRTSFVWQTAAAAPMPQVYSDYMPLTDESSGEDTENPSDDLPVLIEDDIKHAPPEGVLFFTSAASNVYESKAQESENGIYEFSVGVSRICKDDNCDGRVSFHYDVVGGSATVEKDYQKVQSGEIVMGSGESEETITLKIKHDTEIESPETIELMLSKPTGGAMLGTQYRTTVTILDDDVDPTGKGIIFFEQVNDYVNEESGTLNIAVMRGGGE